ncbi:MAG: ArnT family glycosyltransferase, partial [Oceanicaulis sp.]
IDPWVKAALATGAGLLVLRVLALLLDPNALYADETQYWLWSREPDWGYFSKPPLIAWVIWLTTAVFGNEDWAVRLAAPFLHAATATLLGLTAARLSDARTGAVAAILWLTMPAVWLSSAIISTDAVLMVGWSAGLYATVRLRERSSPAFAILLGAAAGWAFLAKYATIYFLLGLALGAVVDAPLRRALISLNGLLAAATFAALISGNLLWNAAHEFATVSHTAANANWSGPLFRPDELLSFVTDQLGVFGPIAFVLLIAAIVEAVRRETKGGFAEARPRLMLAMFVVPALVIVSAQAFISRAHANWAASAYAAGTVLLALYLMNGPRWRRIALAASLAIHAAAGLTLMTFAASPQLAEAAGAANAFKRVREWPQTARLLEAAVDESGAAAVVFDNRNDFHQMQRYGRFDAPLYMWMRQGGPQNFAEATWPLPAGYAEPVLIASERPEDVPLIEGDFDRVEPVGEIAVDIGGGRERRYALFLAQGYAPVTRDAAFEARVRAMRAGD